MPGMIITKVSLSCRKTEESTLSFGVTLMVMQWDQIEGESKQIIGKFIHCV